MHKRGDEWLTPPVILEALGEFDLDPCAATGQPWPTAKLHFCKPQDGLTRQWEGRVWLNPPFSAFTPWLNRMAHHGNGIALLPASTDTAWFQESVWPMASALLFLRGRPHFHDNKGRRAKGNCGRAIVLVAYDDNAGETFNWRSVMDSGLPGAYISQAELVSDTGLSW